MTWSIVARDPRTGAFAVAIATCSLAVGASCPFVRAGVGAVSTQSFTNRYLGPAVLDGMARGLAPGDAIRGALVGDTGEGIRQVHAVDRHGRHASHDGRNCVEWCGSISGRDAGVAGNMLAGDAVVARTLDAWNQAKDLPLVLRLLDAMDAGEAAGGDRRGRQSAALRIVGREDFPDCDLRGHWPNCAGWPDCGCRTPTGAGSPHPRKPIRRASSTSMPSNDPGRRAGSHCGSGVEHRRIRRDRRPVEMHGEMNDLRASCTSSVAT